MKTPIKIFLLAIIFSAIACSLYSSGIRTGSIIKLSNKGMYYKTWEGTINLGGLRSSTDAKGNSTMVANTFDFSIDAHSNRGENINALVDTLTKALEKGYAVQVHYNQELFTNCTCSRGDQQYFIDQVKIIY